MPTGTATSTIYAYKRDLLDFATYLEETTGHPFATSLVTTELVVDYKAYLRIRRLSARTINRRLAALRGLCRHAVAMGWIASDPTVKVAPARVTPAPPPQPGAPGAAAPASRGDRPSVQAALEFGPRPWREVIEPHEDVAAGRYQQAEFAADLAQVLSGKAEPEYQDPVEFFARTRPRSWFPTCPPTCAACIPSRTSPNGLSGATLGLARSWDA